MLKYPVTILLLLLTAVQTFSKWCLIAEFRIERDYIAKNLCVNKDKPQLHCEGQCCLKKRLAQEAKNQAPASSSEQKSKEEVILYCMPIHFEMVHFPVFISAKQYAEYNERSTASFQKTTFHPPAVLI